MGDSDNQEIYRATTTAPVNIAVVKYWGKRDAKLNLPTNSSLSVTLSQNDLRTLTTAATSPSFPEDTLHLNGASQEIATHARTQACLSALRNARAKLESDSDNSSKKLPKFSEWKLRIVSENNFPTAAGLASSASGFAALVRAIADLYELPLTPVELSVIARQGSGSACRSLFGGYVAWNAGSNEDGSDSKAEEIAPRSAWPEMHALILVVSAGKKAVPSTSGMQATVASSLLFSTRAATVVPPRMESMITSIKTKNFSKFAEISMRDSNNFHATCLDTWPPIFYLTDVSKAAIQFVEAVNNEAVNQKLIKEGEYVAGYTFDAGPNAVIFFVEEYKNFVLGAFKGILGKIQGWEDDQTKPLSLDNSQGNGSGGLENVDARIVEMLKGGVARVILTSVGEGPVRIEDEGKFLVDRMGRRVGIA